MVGKILSVGRRLGHLKLATPAQCWNELHYYISHRRHYAPRVPWRPRILSMVTTGQCNLRCRMCHTHSPVIPADYDWRQQTSAHMPFDLFKYTLDRFSGATRVVLAGQGEPLLNPALFRMIRYAVKKHMYVSTISNGVLLHEHQEELLRSGLHCLQVSLNGHNPKTYHQMTGLAPQIYHQICQNLQQLVKRARELQATLKIVAAFIVDQHNYHHIPAFINKARSLGVQAVQLNNFLATPYRGLGPQRTLQTCDSKVVTFLKSVQAQVRDLPVAYPPLLNPASAGKRCRLHFTTLRVDARGHYASCPHLLLNMPTYYHITDRQVWNSSFFLDMRRRFLASRLDQLPEPCRRCPQN